MSKHISASSCGPSSIQDKFSSHHYHITFAFNGSTHFLLSLLQIRIPIHMLAIYIKILQMYKDIPASCRIFQNFSESLRIFQNLSESSRTFQNFSESYRILHNLAEACRILQKHAKFSYANCVDHHPFMFC